MSYIGKHVRRAEQITPDDYSEHIILVAFNVAGGTREAAERELHRALTPLVGPVVDSWWVAEDDRRDGSDCDSAIFVKPGYQQAGQAAMKSMGWA